MKQFMANRHSSSSTNSRYTTTKTTVKICRIALQPGRTKPHYSRVTTAISAMIVTRNISLLTRSTAIKMNDTHKVPSKPLDAAQALLKTWTTSMVFKLFARSRTPTTSSYFKIRVTCIRPPARSCSSRDSRERRESKQCITKMPALEKVEELLKNSVWNLNSMTNSQYSTIITKCPSMI